MQRKAVSKGGDSYEYKVKLLYQTLGTEISSHHFPGASTESLLGSAAQPSTPQVLKSPLSPAVPQNPWAGKVSPLKPPLSPRCDLMVSQPPSPRGRPAEQHRGKHVCPGCAFLSALLHPGEMNRCWVQPGSEGKGRSGGGNLPPTASTF